MMTKHSTPQSNEAQRQSEDAELREHAYDGIQEYDNPMPGWWLWILYLTIAFAPLYLMGVHVFNIIPTYAEDLAASQAEITAMRENFAEQNPSEIVDDAFIASFVGVPEHIEAGAVLFGARCAVCHGPAAEGLIGPNLTDDYWIHGREAEQIFGTITNGVLEKGMTPWGNILSIEERAQLVAFIRSVEGSQPEGAKAPEGELVERT